jgi:hypothetical protein
MNSKINEHAYNTAIFQPSFDDGRIARASKGLSTSAILAAAAGTMLLSDTLQSAEAKVVKPATTTTLTFADIPGTGDVKVLNYALALEDLEADLYNQALARLTTGGVTDQGTKFSGLGFGFSQVDVLYINEFGGVEHQHANFLRAALGSSAIQKYQHNFNIGTMTRQEVVQLIYTAEALGVGAYLGAINELATRKYLQTAGAIQGTEARHTAVMAQVLDILFGAGQGTAPAATNNHGIDQPIAPDTVLATVSGFFIL